MTIENVKTVQGIYEAFGRGAVPDILASVTEATEWDFNGGLPEVPWHRPVSGKAALPGFFRSIAEHVEFERFEPKEMMPSGPHVLVDVRMAFRVKATGKRVEQQQLHWWTLDDARRVVRMRHFEDTAQVRDAVRA